jgi:hypothetical protein
VKRPSGCAVSTASIVTTWRSEWEDEPLSVEKLFSDEQYLRWARGHFLDRDLVQRMFKTRRASVGRKLTREQIIQVIAKSFGEPDSKIKNWVGRSSKDVPKRRRKQIQQI